MGCPMRQARQPLTARLRRGPSRQELGARLSAIEQDLDRVLKRLEGGDKLPQDTDKRFEAVAKEVKSHRRTMLSKSRLWTIWEAVQNVADLDGAAAEIGTYRGGTARFIAASFETLGHEVPLEVIDTFEGHPQSKLSEHDSATHKDPVLFTDTSYESVVDYLSSFDRVTVHKGEFASVAPGLPDQSYRLVHVDVDLYEPTLECLRYFSPRLVPGGVIVLDDYGSPTCPGVDRAAKEYLASDRSVQVWSTRPKQLVLVRRPAT